MTGSPAKAWVVRGADGNLFSWSLCCKMLQEAGAECLGMDRGKPCEQEAVNVFVNSMMGIELIFLSNSSHAFLVF